MIIPFFNDCEVTDATPVGWQTGAVLLNSQRPSKWPRNPIGRYLDLASVVSHGPTRFLSAGKRASSKLNQDPSDTDRLGTLMTPASSTARVSGSRITE